MLKKKQDRNSVRWRHFPRRLRAGIAPCCAALVVALSWPLAQAASLLPQNDENWQEIQPAQAPAFSVDGLVAVEMPRYASLRFGVDPATITVDRDGVVRYVMVATGSSGAINAMYEGIRCATAEVKVYARSSQAGVENWRAVEKPQWRPLPDQSHSWALARQGACMGAAPRQNPADVVRALKASPDRQGR